MASKKEIIHLRHPQRLVHYSKLLKQNSDRNPKPEKLGEDLLTTLPSLITDSNGNETQRTPGPESHIPPDVISGLGLLALFISVAIIIAIIAAVISKMRRKQKVKSENDDMDKTRSRSNSIDPYLQAIIFPTEPTPEWKRYFTKTFQKASQKFTGKEETHKTTIPENLRHQLKHIYVY